MLSLFESSYSLQNYDYTAYEQNRRTFSLCPQFLNSTLKVEVNETKSYGRSHGHFFRPSFSIGTQGELLHRALEGHWSFLFTTILV